MVQSSAPDPANNREVSDIEYERLSARFSDDGVYGTPADLAVISPGTGLSVNIRASVSASLRGHGWSSGGDTVSLPVSANPSSQPRIDWCVLRLDRSDWTVRAAVVEGAPGAGAPSLTQDTGDVGIYEVPLGRVTILGGASSVTVTRAELYVGTRIRPCTSTTRNPNPTPGEQAFEVDTRRLLMWDGATWQIVYQDSGEVLIKPLLTPGWNAPSDSVIELRGGSCYFRMAGFSRVTSLSSSSESRLPLLIPADYQPHSRYQYWNVYIAGQSSASMGRVTIYPKGDPRAGQIWLTQHVTMAAGDSVGATTMTWAV